MTLDLAMLLARRTLALWLLVHAIVAMALALAGTPPRDTVAVGMPALVAVVFGVDLRRRGERMLLANLGVGLPRAIGGALAVAAAAETALGVALGAR